MPDASTSETPLRASFQISLDGEPVAISTVGQAYRFITSVGKVEWMEFRSLHHEAMEALEAAAANAMLTVQATNALRVLFARAKLL
jgi:delta-aminolevulinic acid dehydratase/porphobilinogen synthase